MWIYCFHFNFNFKFIACGFEHASFASVIAFWKLILKFIKEYVNVQSEYVELWSKNETEGGMVSPLFNHFRLKLHK